MIIGQCHCGAVGFQFNDTPEFAVACNCSICRRLGAHWIYTAIENVRISGPPDQTITYRHGKGDLTFHSCKTCGATTHWIANNPEKTNRIAMNLRLADLDVIDTIKLRHFDGANSWTFID